MARWTDLVDFEVHPVLTSPDAAAAVATSASKENPDAPAG
jgi:hypothetical protein